MRNNQRMIFAGTGGRMPPDPVETYPYSRLDFLPEHYSRPLKWAAEQHQGDDTPYTRGIFDMVDTLCYYKPEYQMVEMLRASLELEKGGANLTYHPSLVQIDQTKHKQIRIDMEFMLKFAVYPKNLPFDGDRDAASFPVLRILDAAGTRVAEVTLTRYVDSYHLNIAFPTTGETQVSIEYPGLVYPSAAGEISQLSFEFGEERNTMYTAGGKTGTLPPRAIPLDEPLTFILLPNYINAAEGQWLPTDKYLGKVSLYSSPATP